MNAGATKRLIVVSNRLPFVLDRKGDEWNLKPGSGGLVTALVPVLRDRGGVWIGWDGAPGSTPEVPEAFEKASRKTGYRLKAITLSQDEIDRYYHGYSNESIWPLFHDLLNQCTFRPEFWPAYMKVNRKFAHAISTVTKKDDFVWVHDYQLMDVAHHLRDSGHTARLAFFLHIPFPSPDIFQKLPERQAVLTALLAYDLVGFQTQRDRRNFVQCVRLLVKNAKVRSEGHLHSISVDDHDMHVGSFPIGIDARSIIEASRAAEVVEQYQAIKDRYHDRQLILGVDRLDYTKGIPERLRAYANLLERFPELRRKVQLLQVAVPSREGIQEYDELKGEIDQLVGAVNGRYAELGWTPVLYFFRSLTKTELLSLYQAADIGLITPLKDGMNLVAKEFCACSLNEDSVLVLSQFAGAAAQLGRCALTVNPYDVEQTADAIYHAFRMSPSERRYRIKRLRNNVRRQDVFWWVDSFIRAAIDQELTDFPLLNEYIPEHHEGPEFHDGH